MSQIAQTFCDLLDDADPHAFGRLVEQKIVGFASSALPIASILRSPRLKVLAVWSRRSANLGNIARSLKPRPIPAREHAYLEVLTH